MKKAKKILIWCVVLVFIGCVVYFNQPKTVKSDKQTVKIGLIYPMSGAMGYIGKDVNTVVKNVINKINQDPNRQFNYQLIAHDDEMKPSNTVSIANQMISIDKVNAIITSWSAPSEAVKPIMIKNDLIQFVRSFTNMSDGKNVFNYSNTTADLVPEAYGFIKKQDAKKVALIFQQIPAGAEILGLLKPRLEADGIQFDEYLFGGKEYDAFRTMIAKVKANDYDLILLYAWSPAATFIARELKSQEVTVPILGFDTVENSNFDFTYFDGFYEVGAPYYPQWKEKIGSKLFDPVCMYDAINIIVNTYEKAGKKLGRIPSSQEFRQTMYETPDYPGLVGNAHLESNGLFRIPTAIKKVQDEQIIMQKGE